MDRDRLGNLSKLGNLERLGLWPARLVWLVTPVTVGPALARALEPKPATPALVVEIALWSAWFAVLVAVLTPSPRSLTVCRIVAPGAIGAVVMAAVAEGWSGSVLLALGVGALFTAAVFLPTFADRMINGSAYGSERRMALRPQAFVLLGPIQVAWLLVFGGMVVPPLLMLDERYVLAGVAVVAGAAAVWAGGRILHQLSSRWVVFVPAGFVIRDPMTLVDAVLLRRNEVTAVGPVVIERAGRADRSPSEVDGRIDLSGGAMGLALGVTLRQPTPITVRERGGLRNLEVGALVFSPTLPGAMLAEARIRGMKIGETTVGA